MSVQKLLKSPGRLLLLTCVVTYNYATNASPSNTGRAVLAPVHGQNPVNNVKQRVRQNASPQGVQRWGLNE